MSAPEAIHTAIIKSVTLRLDKVLKGNPIPVTLCCVYSYNALIGAPMAIGYVLAVNETITEIRCFNEGMTPTQAFMNTDKISIKLDEHNTIESTRIFFMDVGGKGEFKAGMMQGESGENLIVTSNSSEEDWSDLL